MNGMKRVIGRIAAVSAVALVLAGAATPAAARERSDAVWSVNHGMGVCFEGGGDPYVFEWNNAFIMTCYLENGEKFTSRYPYDE
jgi:hypothetical protein